MSSLLMARMRLWMSVTEVVGLGGRFASTERRPCGEGGTTGSAFRSRAMPAKGLQEGKMKGKSWKFNQNEWKFDENSMKN